LLIPTILVIAVVLPGNQFLPLASLAGMFYLFPVVLPITKGNVIKTFIVGLVALIIGLYFVTDMAPDFTKAAAAVYKATNDPAAKIPDGFSGGALDFASSLYGWVIYKFTCYIKYIGPAILSAVAIGMAMYNRHKILQDEKLSAEELKLKDNNKQ
jgi:PTS system galactitol-specific IIC component